MYFYILLFLLLCVYTYYSSFISETYHNFRNNYTRVKTLTKTMPGIQLNISKLFITSIKTIFSLFFVYLTQNWHKTVKRIGFNHYEITYAIRGRSYKLRVKPTKLPKVLQVIDENDEDVTTEMEPYLGADEKFHGKEYTPADLKYKSLTFNMADGNVLEFEEKDYIKLS